jgi:hypothetical protein
VPKSEFRDSTGAQRSPFACELFYRLDMAFGVFPVRAMYLVRWYIFGPLTVISLVTFGFGALWLNGLILWVCCVLFKHWDIIELAAASRPSGWNIRSSRKIVAKRLGWIAFVSAVLSAMVSVRFISLGLRFEPEELWASGILIWLVSGPGIVCLRHLVLMYIDIQRDEAGITFYFDYQEEEPDPEPESE